MINIEFNIKADVKNIYDFLAIRCCMNSVHLEGKKIVLNEIGKRDFLLENPSLIPVRYENGDEAGDEYYCRSHI